MKLPADFPTLASKERVARELDMSIRKVDRLRDSGELSAVKVGASVRFTRDSVERYLASLPAA